MSSYIMDGAFILIRMVLSKLSYHIQLIFSLENL